MLDSYIRPDAPNPDFKTDEELHYIIDNREKYLPESVEAALSILQHRGIEFSEEELRVISEDMAERRRLALLNTCGWARDRNNYIDDPDAYTFYSRQTIRVFAILFSTFFGSVMMAINIGKTRNTTGVVSVVVFGLFFTTAQIIILNAIKTGSSLGIIFSIAGASCLDYFFWGKYIGNAALYRRRTYWVPAIIGIVITGLVITAIIVGGNAD